MSVFLSIAANVVYINFYGFVVNIDKDWYEANHYIALDNSGELYVYDLEPHVSDKSSHWQTPITKKSVLGDELLDLSAHMEFIDGLEAWVEENWDKQYWNLKDFPLVELKP